MQLPLTPSMSVLQSTLFVIMETCLKELRRSCRLINEDALPLTIEKSMFHGFDYALKRMLEPDWHRVSALTKQLLADLTSIRKLLDLLVQYDAIDLHLYLCLLRDTPSTPSSSSSSSAAPAAAPSPWLTTQAADVLFQRAKERVYTLQPLPADYRGVHRDVTEHRLRYSRTLIPSNDAPITSPP